MLGTRQTGWADIMAYTHNTDGLLTNGTYGQIATYNEISGISSEVGGMSVNLGSNTGNQATISDYLEDVLGTRNFGETQIQPATKNAYAILSNGTYGNQAIETEVAQNNSDIVDLSTTVGTDVGNKSSISEYLVYTLGLRQAGQDDNHGILQAIIDDLHDPAHGATNLAGLLKALGYPSSGGNNPAEDFITTRTAFSIIDTLSALVTARFGGGLPSLGNTFQNAALNFLGHSGVQVSINADVALKAAGTAPPISSLTIGSYAAITSQQVDAIPDGAYGCRIIFTEPGGWGKIANWPLYFVPPIARIDYADRGFFGYNPINVQTDFVLAYPLPPWADSMVISLGVGVTAERAWLTL